MHLRVAPNPASSGCADGEFPGCPESSLLRRRRLMDLRVSSNLAPSGGAASASSGCPESCIYGRVDDDSPARLELCILCPRQRMNLRVQSGLAHSRLTLDAFSIQLRHSICRTSRLCTAEFNRFRIFLSGWNCVSNSLQGHQLARRVGRFNLWKQVQKAE